MAGASTWKQQNGLGSNRPALTPLLRTLQQAGLPRRPAWRATPPRPSIRRSAGWPTSEPRWRAAVRRWGFGSVACWGRFEAAMLAGIAAGGLQGDWGIHSCPAPGSTWLQTSSSYATAALWMVGANKPLKPGEEAGDLNRPRPAKSQHSASLCGATPEVTAVCRFTSPTQRCCAKPMLQHRLAPTPACRHAARGQPGGGAGLHPGAEG